MKNYVALGDFVLDVYHDARVGLLGYYAGGSVWNDLLNIKESDFEANCYCIATCGRDWAGDYILELLNERGIDTAHVNRVNKQTKRFHIIVDEERTRSQLECPVCNEKIWYTDSKLPDKMPDSFNFLSKGIVIVDSLKKNVLELAKSFRASGWLVAADIGHIAHLRYMSSDNIRALVQGVFDVVQMTSSVKKFLLNKLSCNNESDLYELLECQYLSITDGERGSIFIYRGTFGQTVVKNNNAFHTKVIDPTGAGDAFFSKLLQQLDERGQFEEDIDSVLMAAGIYASNRVSVLGANGMYRRIAIPACDCAICGNVIKKTTKPRIQHQKIATNTNHLLDRTLRALESGAAKRLQEVLNSINGNILMIGTGGSFAAAEFAAKCVNQYHPSASARSCRPRDALIMGIEKVDAVILFSYSGRTKDIQNVYQFCEKRGVPVFVLTKLDNLDNIEPYSREALISYNSTKSSAKEHGFISMAGTLIPMCLFGQIYYSDSDSEFLTFLKECFERRSHEFSEEAFFDIGCRELCVDVFSGVDTSCTAIDLESKFIESGLARVVIHEKKDFSHGRFNIIEQYSPDFIIFLNNVSGSYSDALFKYLQKRNTLHLFKMSSHCNNLWGDLDLVIAAEFFSKYLSKALSYDMAKPNYPEDAMTLYRYSRKDLY